MQPLEESHILLFKGFKVNFVAKIITTICAFLQLLIIIYLIDKSEYGTYALSIIPVFLLLNLADLGSRNIIIEDSSYDRKMLSSIHWCSIFAGIGLTILTVVLSYVMSLFYSNQLIFTYGTLLSSVILFQSIGYVYGTLLLGKLEFKQIASIEIVISIASLVILWFFAQEGFNAFALIFAILGKSILELLMNIFYGSKWLKLSYQINWESIKPILNNSKFQLGERLINYLNKQADNLIIGKILGTEILGVYDILKKLAFKIIEIVNPAITTVSFPIMTTYKHHVETIQKTYLRQLSLISTLNFPYLVFLIAFADLIIQIFFPQKNLPYNHILILLSVYFAFYSVGNPVGTLIMSRGRFKMGFLWNLFVTLILPIVILIGITGGLKTAITAMDIMQLFLFFVMYYFIVRPLSGLSFALYFKTIVLPFLISLIIVGLALMVRLLNFDGITTVVLAILVVLGSFIPITRIFNRKAYEELTKIIGAKT
ncbi:MAG: oligosaccharide flippase family protein [Melioribacteraceae bacterium]|nr:oligosaccharide flippase family protein [Melioribacteraceae bacterium]